MYRPRVTAVQQFLKEGAPYPIYKKPKPKTSRCDQIQYFCSTTANHGFAHVVDRNELCCLRILWALVIASLGSVVMLLIYMSVTNLASRALTTEFQEKEYVVDPNGVVLPDIHICDASIFNSERLKATSNNAATDFFASNTDYQTAMKAEFDRILANGSYTIKDVMESAAISCTKMVVNCSLAGRPYESNTCCTQFFTASPYVSIFGSCISTHGKSIRQIYPSRDAGFVVYLLPNTLHIIDFEDNLIKPEYILQKGVYYTVSGPAVAIESVLHTAGRFAPPNSWVSVPITKSLVDNSELKDNILAPYTCVDTNDSVYKECRTPDYDRYSRPNCYGSYFQKTHRQLSNCSAIYYKYGNASTLCHPQQILNFQKHFRNSELLDCPVSCITDHYEMSPSNAEFNTDFLERKFNVTKLSTVALHFFYSSFDYQIRVSHTSTMLKWLGEIGGNMGLFLGASLISVLEMLALVIRCCMKTSL